MQWSNYYKGYHAGNLEGGLKQAALGSLISSGFWIECQNSIS